MANIRPFRGIRYDQARVPDLSQVVTQPYDRITDELQRRYHEQHINSFVRLVKNRATRDDTAADNVYVRANSLYRSWLDEGLLVQDESPAVYVYHQTFSYPAGRELTRKAFVAALELAPFETGVVLPHEHTLNGPKADRLRLLRATAVNLEPVFLLYPDPQNQINTILDAAIAGQPPTAEVRDLHEHEVRQRLWVVTDPAVIGEVRSQVALARRLIIADGHHRYQARLAYREEMRAAHPDSPSDAPHNFTITALVNMDDPSLTILPTHRLVHSCGAMSVADLLDAAAEYFHIDQMPDRASLLAALPVTGCRRHAIGLATSDQQFLWTLKDVRAMDELAPDHVPAWRDLDVSILQKLVFEKLLGLIQDSIDRQENLRYLRDPMPGYRALDNGDAQFLFLLNPTRVAQVRACAEAGEMMPQKSTDFYPKMISGLVAMAVR